MAFDQLPLDRPSPHAPLPPSTHAGPSRWIVLGAAVVVAGALLAWFWLSRARPDAAAPASTATDVATGSRRPKRQPMDLPPLDASDSVLRDTVSVLSHHPLLARLLATDGLVRGLALTIVQIGDGRTPIGPLTVLRPQDRLTLAAPATETTGGRVDPASYRRWDSATSALVSVNPVELAQVYVNVKPLIDQAYRELGHPSGDFDDAIVRAIRTLEDTPQVSTEPMLMRGRGYYEHEDPALKALLPVQKQLLLMGPDNRRRLMGWLKQLAAALELRV